MNERKVMNRILWILVIMQFFGIAYINFTRSYGYLELDTSYAIRHALDMWRNGLFLQDFHYTTSMEIDCATFFAAPIYLLTRNLNTALGIVHSVLYLIVAFFLYRIAFHAARLTDREVYWQEMFLLSVLVIFTPYASALGGYLDWSIMLFICGGQYEFRLIIVLSVLHLMLIADIAKTAKREFIPCLIFCCLICFWTSLSTDNFVLFMIIFPFFLKQVIDVIRRQKLSLLSADNVSVLLLIAFCLFGMLMRNANGIITHRDNLPLVGARDFWSNAQSALTGIFLLFGALERGGSTMLFSLDGISTLLRFAFVILCVALVVSEALSRKNRSVLYISLFCVMAVNMGLFFLTYTTYGSDIFEHRYHIVWCTLLLVAAAYAMMSHAQWPNRYLAFLVSWGMVLVVALINITGFRELALVAPTKWFEEGVLELADKYEVENILLYNKLESSANLLAMDPDRNSINILYWGGEQRANTDNYYWHCGDNEFLNKKNLLVCDIWDFAGLPSYIQSQYTLVDDTLVGPGHHIYYADYSLWDAISGLPLPGETRSVDYPDSNGYSYLGEIGENRQLTASSPEDGYILWGPYERAIPGVYNITLYYHINEEGTSPAFFCVNTDNGERTLMKGTLSAKENSCTLAGLDITGSAPLEFCVWQYAGGEIEIERIVFERVDTSS